MKWESYRIITTTQAEDLIVDMLSELGINGAEIQDHRPVLKGDTLDFFKDVMPEQEEDDGKAEVIFYLEEGDNAALLESVKEGLEELKAFADLGDLEVISGETEDVDWINNWKKNFHAFYVDDILVKPTWVSVPEDYQGGTMIEIDPGTAFGTGSHETTRLCIHGILKYIQGGEKVLDVGTGSGILGIAALKEGAKEVLGTDIDELSIKAAGENVELNGYGEKDFSVILGNIIDDEAIQKAAGEACYDLVLANILADIIIPLQKMIWKTMKIGGIFICSGIINLKEEAVYQALSKNPHFQILDRNYEGEWVSFEVKRIA